MGPAEYSPCRRGAPAARPNRRVRAEQKTRLDARTSRRSRCCNQASLITLHTQIAVRKHECMDELRFIRIGLHAQVCARDLRPANVDSATRGRRAIALARDQRDGDAVAGRGRGPTLIRARDPAHCGLYEFGYTRKFVRVTCLIRARDPAHCGLYEFGYTRKFVRVTCLIRARDPARKGAGACTRCTRWPRRWLCSCRRRRRSRRWRRARWRSNPMRCK